MLNEAILKACQSMTYDDGHVDDVAEAVAAGISKHLADNLITDDLVERMCAAWWNVTSNTKWDDPNMNPEWKPAYRTKMRAALQVLA